MWPNKKKISNWIGQNKLPNQMKDYPNISFRAHLSAEAKEHLKQMGNLGKRSLFINQAIEMKVWHNLHRKGFLAMMIQNNFTLCKHLIRQIGRTITSKVVNRE